MKRKLLLVGMFIAGMLIGSVGVKNNYVSVSAEENFIYLSEMTEEECIDFILNEDIEIPNDIINNLTLGNFVKEVITRIEINPTYSFAFSYNGISEFVEQIRVAVNNYYGENIRTNYSLSRSVDYQL